MRVNQITEFMFDRNFDCHSERKSTHCICTNVQEVSQCEVNLWHKSIDDFFFFSLSSLLPELTAGMEITFPTQTL